MKFQLVPPTHAFKRYDQWMAGGGLVEMAQLGEALGYDGFALTDHPFPSDAWLASGGHHAFDPFVGLSFCAAATQRIKLMTGVLVAGYRNPYLAAKSAATLDKLSGGRLVLGVGAGYLEEEFKALGADFAKRGPIFDEALVAMKAAWSGHSVQLPGPFFPAHGHTPLPLPTQTGGPPIWIGGNGKPAMRRAIEIGDGWMPVRATPAVAAATRMDALADLNELKSRVAVVQDARRARGAAPADILSFSYESGETWADTCTGLRNHLAAYEDAGVTWIMVRPNSRSYALFKADVEFFAETVFARGK